MKITILEPGIEKPKLPKKRCFDNISTIWCQKYLTKFVSEIFSEQNKTKLAKTQTQTEPNRAKIVVAQ